MFIKSLALFLMLMVLSVSLQAQNTYTSKQALEVFKNKDYKQAQEAYEYLLIKYDREPKYNYYYGICLLQNNQDIGQAVKRLKYAALKGVSRDAYYYLGRAYQLNYEFDEAIKQYDRFLKYASASDIRNDKAEMYRTQCEVGKGLSSKVYSLEVNKRDTLIKADLLNYYNPVDDAGKIMTNSDFFEAGVDPNGILYLTERGDEVYFTLVDENNGQRDLYKMEKLLDGWGESTALDALNSEADEMYPYLMIDGKTLFFSSNREGGLGGYDIYKSTFDSESKSFNSPVNLGIPFNSPKDDFFFVTDEFNSKGWFASNRETSDSLIMVYQIKWDDSVVKSLVTDMNEVKDVASLSLSELADGDKSFGTNGGRSKAVKKKDSFRFMVADTIVYNELSHFNSDEAKRYFQEGQKLLLQKDSLSLLMRGQRDRYARTSSDTERAMLVNDILSLEKQVYGLDGKVEQSLNNARYTEITRIKELIRQGRYIAPSQVKIKKDKEAELEDLLIPSEYTFYTDEEFEHQLSELEEMYSKLFNAEDVEQLKKADSLYIWGHILNLESSKLLESASSQPAQVVPIVSSPFKRRDSIEEQESVVDDLMIKSKELKHTALKVYHSSLDKKYELYRKKINELVAAKPTVDFTFIEEPQSAANTYFRQANELMNPLLGYDAAKYEKAGALKRSGVQEQEGALFVYLDSSVSESSAKEPEVGVVKGKSQKTYQELQNNDVLTAKVVEKSLPEHEFRIQIGVFRNTPNPDALSKIPATTSANIPGKDLVKYFSGSYSTYAAATKDLAKIRGAGFSGAFIVVFKEGKQINLTNELKK